MKILLIESDEYMVVLLSKVLLDQSYALEIARDGQIALASLRTGVYDLLLLDIDLPDFDGVRLCRQIRQEGYQMPILLLFDGQASSYCISGLDAGADDYMKKPLDLVELAARSRALLRRGQLMLPTVLNWGKLRLDPATCTVYFEDNLLPLTAKEYGILELLLRCGRRILTRENIAEHLWPATDSPSEGTVKTHISGIRQKIREAGSTIDPIETVYGFGYRLQRAPSEDSFAAPGESTSAEQEQQIQIMRTVAGVWECCKDGVENRLGIVQQAQAALRVGSNVPQQLLRQAEQQSRQLAVLLGTFGLIDASLLSYQIQQVLRDQARSINGRQVELLGQLVDSLREQLNTSIPCPALPSEPTLNPPAQDQ